jgi:two-component system, OmpR family, response regulator
MDGASHTVVVVDDEHEVLDLICSVLKEEGYAVVCLSHPVLTDDLKGRDPEPHLFMLDIMLPSMSGIDLAHRLRRDGFAETPMIAMSASPTMLDRAHESALFHGYLGKPFDLDTLLRTVEQHTHTTDG